MLAHWLSALLLLLPMISWAETAQPVPWEMAKNQDGITIQTRKHRDGLVEIRAQMFVNTTYAAFMTLLEDSNNVPNWIDNVDSSRVLKQISDNENIVYTRFAAPWPARDRDMVTYSQFKQFAGALVLTIEDASDQYPEQEGFVRIKAVKATWTLEKLTNGMTHIDYTAFADPGGMLPNWLANKLSVSSAFNTFEALREQLPKYQGKRHPHVTE
ncbi:START domain-containing protein [Vibrio fluvialis]|uniref:START domain-containing protein n=1 Tax=Vibrio fluvialis TaxID=676 RepID=UPI001EEB7C59|nr:START domain-containing protein [Vibrio fluvialis]ELS8948387.1 START domain-containing protein [Vibrio fluvialis]MCG6386000.1 START domain-containing protein [Vibrio fluvialis]